LKITGNAHNHCHGTAVLKVSLIVGLATTGLMMWSSPIQAEVKDDKVMTTNAVKDDSQVITGKTGTCEWTFQDGILKIGAGNFARNGSWRQYVKQIIEIQFTGKVVLPAQSYKLFSELPQLQRFSGADLVDTSQVTNMGYMFQFDQSLKELDLRNWDVRQVTSMPEAFWGTTSLQVLRIENWETPRLDFVRGMFTYCGVQSLDLRRWSINKVDDLSNMFSGMNNLTSLDLRGWQTQNVTTMASMFAETPSLRKLQLGDEWDTGHVIYMDNTFEHTGLMTLDLRRWDVSHVTTMVGMFQNCHNLEILNIGNWQTGNVTDMSQMFSQALVKSLPLENWDVSHVTKMSQMFARAGVRSLDLHRWDVRNVVNFEQLFAASAAEDINVSGWQTPHAGSFQKLFYLSQARKVDLSGFDMTHLDYNDDSTGYWGEGRVELMLGNMPYLHILRLGPKNLLQDAKNFTVGLGASSGGDFQYHANEHWHAVGKGTVDHPQGQLLTAKALEEHYTPAMAGTYVREVQAAPVIVYYRDLITNKDLRQSRYLSGIVDAPFTIKTDFPGYRYQRASAPLTGTFWRQAQAVVLYYLKEDSDLGSATLRAVDDEGNRLLPDSVQTGKIGAHFPIVAPEIAGYKLHRDSPLPKQGVFTLEPQVLTLLYRKLRTVRVWYLEQSTKRELHQPEVFEGETGTAYQVEQFTKDVADSLAGYTFKMGVGLPGKYGEGNQNVYLLFEKNAVVKPDPTPTPQVVEPEKPAESVETVENGGSGDLISTDMANQGSSKSKKQRRKVKKVSPQPDRRGGASAVSTGRANIRQNQTLPATGEANHGWWATLAGVIGLSLLSLDWFKRQD